MFRSNAIEPVLTGGRRTDISSLRVLAVLLLFPFHTARVFNVGEQFYVKNDHVSRALSYFVDFMGPWHMPLLFLLAGAASWFALSRRSGTRYSGERFKRLLIPFLVGLVVLIPPQSYLGLLSHSGSAPGYFQWLPNFFHLNGNDMDGYFLGGHTWCHLWFIVHLFFYSLLALPVMLFLRRRIGTRVLDLLARAASLPGVILLFALALVPAMFVPDIAGGNPALYIAFFLLGYVMVADARFEKAIDRHKLFALVLGPLACLLVTYFEVTAWPAIPSWAQGPLHVYLQAFMPWFFMVALLGYGRRFLGATSRFATGLAGRLLRHADEASYPVYLLHQTVIVAVAFLVVQLQVGVALKFAAILIGSLVATVLIYEVALRRVRVARFLSGMKPLPRRSGATDGSAHRAPVLPAGASHSAMDAGVLSPSAAVSLKR
jgi:glucan biosynthesis protein C